MLSMAAMGRDQGEYYLNLSQEDYYLEGGEPPGKWLGRGAEKLGLKGNVEKEQLRCLLQGFRPDSGEALIQNAGDTNHRPGWDLTFSAPKSVSVLWSQAPQKIRAELQKAHEAAVSGAIAYLQSSAAFTRRGKEGRMSEPADLIVATFEHGTSRAQDPQLHTHALVMNVGVRADGTTGSIVSRPLFQHKMAAGALYRVELSYQLERRLGLETERHGSWFELSGVPKGLVDEFSKRRAQIEEALSARSDHSAKAAAVATLSTRETKGQVARAELFAEWQEVGRKMGFSTEQLADLMLKQGPRFDVAERMQTAIDQAIAKITESSSHFSERELVRRVAEESQGQGLWAELIHHAAVQKLERSDEIVRLGRVNGEQRFTTKEMLDLERKLLSQVAQMANDGTHRVSQRSVEGVLQGRPTIKEEQANALRHITVKSGAVQVVSGLAGTGKTYMLDAAREAWERGGLTVEGTALSGKAAQGLQEGSGIRSETIHKRLKDLSEGKFALSNKTVLVVDEAGMVGTRMLQKLVEKVADGGGKLVLVGDAKQLQPIEAGGPFKSLGVNLGEARLTEITRQRETWAREAVHSLIRGDANSALESFAEKGLLTVSEDRDEAMQHLVSDWKEAGSEKPKDHLIIAGTNLEATVLNRMIQEDRRLEGMLGRRSVSVDSCRIHEGDRVLFTRNSGVYGVKNGNLGTVEGINLLGRILTVELDGGTLVHIPVEHYPHLRLGYAVTTHKSQGMTVENAYVLVGGAMQDRELSYVQASRARNQTRIYTDRLEAGEELAELSRQMSKSREKDLASDVLAQARERQLSPSLER